MENTPLLSAGLNTNGKIVKKVGDYLVVDSGVLHTKGLPLSIEIDTMKIEFNFRDDKKFPESEVESVVDENNKLKLGLNLYNFNNILGSGYIDPIEFGTFKGVKYYITFMVNGYENMAKQLSYTILTKG